MPSTRSSGSWISLILLSAACLFAGAFSVVLGLIYWQHPARTGAIGFTVQIDAGEELEAALIHLERTVSGWNLGAPRVRIEDAPTRQLRVEFPTANPARIASLLQARGEIEFQWVARRLEIGEAGAPPGPSDPGLEVVCQSEERMLVSGASPCYEVESTPVLVNADLQRAKPSTGSLGEPVLSLEFTPQAASRLREVTAANTGRQLAIVIDGEVLSAPIIEVAIGRRAIVRGPFSEEEVADLAKSLSSGELPALTVVDWKKVPGDPWLEKLKVGLAASFLAFAVSLAAITWLAIAGARPKAGQNAEPPG